MNVIKLDEMDESFFLGLKEGNFILVLGAGFSFGIPNKSGATIPVGKQFAGLTKVRFGISYDLDYSTAAEVWETNINDQQNKSELLTEFKNHFLVDESKFDSKEYASIFFPNWYNIFTLNFDNVLEVIQRDTKQKQLNVFSYPHESSGLKNPDILHLHGMIKDDTTLDTIVFTPDSYKDLPSKEHTLYNVLYGNVKDHKKNIVIVGSQFKEITVRQKFFKGLPKDKSVKIFHFDIESELEYVTEFRDRDYYFIHLDKDKGGVKLLLQILQNRKDFFENIHIEGTEIINSSFIKRIQEGEIFTRADFYTAKLADDCQWYGIINNYDMVRDEYSKIKCVASKCFDKFSRNKVVAVVHGLGGSGKSTLLRRLAIDLRDEPFKVVWLKDREFDNLADIGLKQIKDDSSRNYLLIIEDWYRITANERTKEFLLNSQTIRNLRIIIGDRETDGKDYIDNLVESKNQFYLQSDENQKIVNDILNKYPVWRPAAEEVLKNNSAETTSLFLLLFVIARINEEKYSAAEIDFTDPASAFRDIVKSDLKKINNKYPGLAKALHYWACVYTNYKIFIDYTTFLKVADSYNGNSEVSDNLGNWDANSPLLTRLKNYISNKKNTSLRNIKLHSYDFVQFNQDKLAEDGLAKIVLDGWDVFYNPNSKKYDDILLKKFVKIILTSGTDYFSSVLLSKMLYYQKDSFNVSEKKGFIKLLYDKGNLSIHYLNHLTDIDINYSEAEIKNFLYELFDKNVYPEEVWINYFKMANQKAKHEAAIKILAAPDINQLKQGVVVTAFNQKGYDVKSEEDISMAKHDAAIKILTAPDINSLQQNMVVSAFSQKGFDAKSDEEISIAKYNVALKILAALDITQLKQDIVVAAFNQKGYDVKSEEDISIAKLKAALKILADPDITQLKQDIVVAAFCQNGYDVKSEEDISIAKHKAAIIILSTPDITLLQQNIVVSAFNQNGYNVKSEEESIKSKEEISIVKYNAAQTILSDENWKETQSLVLVVSALKYFSSINNYPEICTQRVEAIIRSFLQAPKLKINRDYYFELMSIPFHQNKLWTKACNYIISHWSRIDRRGIVSVLHSNISKPMTVRDLCVSVLANWPNEISYHISQINGKSLRGEHIKLALGHPNLKEIAIIKATEMAQETNLKSLPESLREFVLKIVNSKGIPEWITPA